VKENHHPDSAVLALALAAPSDLKVFEERFLEFMNQQFAETKRAGRRLWGEAFLVMFQLYPEIYLT
jgi:hypothetical protein